MLLDAGARRTGPWSHDDTPVLRRRRRRRRAGRREGAARAGLRGRLLRAEGSRRRPLAHGLRVAAPDHVAGRLGLRGYPMPPELPGVPEPRPDARRTSSRSPTARPAAARHVRDRGDRRGTHGPAGERGWWVDDVATGGATRYDGVLVANGHLWDPNCRRSPATSPGSRCTRRSTATRDDIEGDRVLVVGAGNSGCDLAVDAANARLRRRSRCGAGRCSSRRHLRPAARPSCGG